MPLIPKQEPPYYEQSSTTEGIKEYIALLAQTGTAAPTATILKNTLDLIPTWAYDTTGNFSLTATDTFTLNKTIVFISVDDDVFVATWRNPTNDLIELYTYDDTWTPLNVFNNMSIHIIVYP